jgi:hypothetical protein
MAGDPWGIESPEADALAAEFRRIRSRLKPEMRKVAVKAAMNVRDDARALILAQASKGFVAQYPRSIGYTITESSGSQVTAEIGPDKERPQGALGNILEYGTSKNPPYPHLQPALVAETDRFERFLGDAAEAAMFE